MSASVACDEIADLGLLERYLRDRLAAAEEEAVEAHLLVCEHCEQRLRLLVAVHGALQSTASSTGVPATSQRATMRARWGPWAVLAVAAAVTAVWIIRPDRPLPAVVALGVVDQLPAYAGIPVRARPDADSLFVAAMVAYNSARWTESLALLERHIGDQRAAATAEFYRASSLLALGRPLDAAEGYARVMTLDPSPYVHAARYYRAKALLQLGRGDDALNELREAARAPASLGTRAGALADSVRAALAR